MPALRFEITGRCQESHARVGRVATPHGAFDTPAFMPVGTQGTVKGLLPSQVQKLGAQVILANTYHLMLRPGSPLVHQMGGLHTWSRWPGPILTDSGGFQVYSLADINRITDHGVGFRSHLDGAWFDLTPARSIQIQNELGADIIMAFDDCPPAIEGPTLHAPSMAANDESDGCAGDRVIGNNIQTRLTADVDRIRQACERTVRWLDECVRSHERTSDQALFGIVQGGIDLDLRSWCAQRVLEHDLPGFAIGGLAVGEGYEAFKRVIGHTTPLLPADKPRYVMGVGYERDILASVLAGVDMFDCVLPTRNGRNAYAFTTTGPVRLRNTRFKGDPQMIEPGCDCPACQGGYSRSYLRHLFQAREMLGPILVSMHNLRHFQRYMLDIRRAITDNAWPWFRNKWSAVIAPEPDRG